MVLDYHTFEVDRPAWYVAIYGDNEERMFEHPIVGRGPGRGGGVFRLGPDY